MSPILSVRGINLYIFTHCFFSQINSAEEKTILSRLVFRLIYAAHGLDLFKDIDLSNFELTPESTF